MLRRHHPCLPCMKRWTINGRTAVIGRVVELVDTQDLGSCASRRAGSSPAMPTRLRPQRSGGRSLPRRSPSEARCEAGRDARIAANYARASLACISDPSWVKTVAHLSRGAFVRRWRAETACCMFDPFTSNENPLWRGDLQNPSEIEKWIGEKCGLLGWMDKPTPPTGPSPPAPSPRCVRLHR